MFKTFRKFFSPFWRLGRQYNKFWLLASISILLGLIPITFNTRFFTMLDICEETSKKSEDKITISNRCRLTNAAIGLSGAILISSLTQILTGVAQIWSLDEDQSEFDYFFGLDSSNTGKDQNSVGIIIPKFPMSRLDTIIEDVLKANKEILKNEQDSAITEYAKKIGKGIKNNNLTTDGNIVKRLSEVKEAVLAVADVKTTASITNLFGMKGFIVTDIIQDDIGNLNSKDSCIKINGKQYTTIFVIGLFSNSFLNEFNKLFPNNYNPPHCFTLSNVDNKRCVTIKKYSHEYTNKNNTNTPFQQLEDSTDFKDTTDDYMGLIAKTIYKETSVIFIGGISAEGTVAIGEFLENDWKEPKHELFNKVKEEIASYNGRNKDKEGFEPITLSDKVDFAISIKLPIPKDDKHSRTASIQQVTFKPSNSQKTSRE